MKLPAFFRFARLALFVLLCAPSHAAADPLAFSYVSPTAAVDVVLDGQFSEVDFFGSITNTSGQNITFQLQGGPVPFEPYVAQFITGVPFPGITLGPGQSTGVFEIAKVVINPFDPSLPYPGFVEIVLPAVDPNTGATIATNDLSIEVVRSVPEPTVFVLMAVGLALLALMRLVRD
jgi:hypothetical protein